MLNKPKALDVATWAPAMDIFSRDDRLVIRAALPGVAKEDVDIQVTDGSLTIVAERRCEVEDAPFRHARLKHRRIVRLPAGVKPDAVSSTFADSMLEIVVPLSDKPKAA
jgi:HSP20 family protein